MKRSAIFATVMLTALLMAAKYEIKVTSSSKTGIVKAGEQVKVTATAFKDGKPIGAEYKLFVAKWEDGKGMKYSLVPANKKYQTTLSVKQPGWSYVTFGLRDARKKVIVLDGKKRSVGTGIAFDMEKIKPARPEPADFDKFWNDAKAELAKVPLKVLEKKQVVCWPKTYVCYDLKISCAGPKPVSGYLVMPKKPGKYPAFLSLHGAGVGSSGKRLRKNAISLDINAHGLPNGLPRSYYLDLRRGALKGYYVANNGDRDKIYFRYMFLRVKRALEYLKSMPEWNGKDLIVTGSSQGGAQAIFAAGIDPDVSMISIMVPAMTDISGSLAPFQRMGGWPKPYRRGEKNETKISAWDYYDGVNFARRINCKVYVSAGLIDGTCPPSGVYCMYNQLKTKDKFIEVHRDMGHVARNDAGNKAVKDFLDGQAKK